MQCVTLLLGEVAPSSSTTNSNSVPSGSSVRSSRCSRPFPHPRAKGTCHHCTAADRGLASRPRERHGRTPRNTAAYAKKSLQKLCRNCVTSTRKPRRTWTNTASHRRAPDGGKSLIRLCVAMGGCCSVQVAGSTFQACTFNHSDISPSLESTICGAVWNRLSHTPANSGIGDPSSLDSAL